MDKRIIAFPGSAANDVDGLPKALRASLGDNVEVLIPISDGDGLFDDGLPGIMAASIWDECAGCYDTAFLFMSEIHKELGALRLRQLERRLLPPRTSDDPEPEAA